MEKYMVIDHIIYDHIREHIFANIWSASIYGAIYGHGYGSISGAYISIYAHVYARLREHISEDMVASQEIYAHRPYIIWSLTIYCSRIWSTSIYYMVDEHILEEYMVKDMVAYLEHIFPYMLRYMLASGSISGAYNSIYGQVYGRRAYLGYVLIGHLIYGPRAYIICSLGI